ncbi:putative inorganic phosphate transporter 1-3 [Acorus calamus]|uniref:Inorganic phosphate transporter 1-3 n=1 Tax=Acorus calamus TaxID=4465 RepID=A0AAV9C4D8_ACOCL|nr:putative inorganic phosphate transporter 1-3 [Acorus calamus]
MKRVEDNREVNCVRMSSWAMALVETGSMTDNMSTNEEVFCIAKILIALCGTLLGYWLSSLEAQGEPHWVSGDYNKVSYTTFIGPVEIFPARLRSTFHGISVVLGKAGVTIGVFGSPYAAQPNMHK